MEQFELILFKRCNNLLDTCIIYSASGLIPCPLSGKMSSHNASTGQSQQGVCYTVALPYTLKSILR
jgi:hypothetical protein